MSDTNKTFTHDHGPHQHAHAAPTTQQIRTIGQRRRDAEEKLEHHLDEARHKTESRATTNQADPEPDGASGSRGGDSTS